MLLLKDGKNQQKMYKMQKYDQNYQNLLKNRTFSITDKNNLNICIDPLIVRSLVNENMIF